MKAKLASLMTSGIDHWETPNSLFESYNKQLLFTIDLAANAANTKCKRYFGPGSILGEDALKQSWQGECGWLNPPYSTKLQTAFLKKAYEESRSGTCTVVALIPSRTDTIRWHHYVMKAERVIFLQGRVKFEMDGKPVLDKKNKPVGAPFPSAIVIFGAR